jgi:hypothetical protein
MGMNVFLDSSRNVVGMKVVGTWGMAANMGTSKTQVFLLGNSSASEVYMLTFQNTPSVPFSQAGRRV